MKFAFSKRNPSAQDKQNNNEYVWENAPRLIEQFENTKRLLPRLFPNLKFEFRFNSILKTRNNRQNSSFSHLDSSIISVPYDAFRSKPDVFLYTIKVSNHYDQELVVLFVNMEEPSSDWQRKCGGHEELCANIGSHSGESIFKRRGDVQWVDYIREFSKDALDVACRDLDKAIVEYISSIDPSSPNKTYFMLLRAICF